MDLTENLNIDNNIFFESTFGKIINNSIEFGIRALLPDGIENDIIDIKNTLINQGVPEAINELINKVVNLGKNAFGIIKDNFENINQIENIFNSDNLINGVSEIIDNIIENNNILPENINNLIKNGKDFILSNVLNNVKKEIKNENNDIKKLKNYNKKWKDAYEKKDFKEMEKNIKKINKIMNNIAPIEDMINEARTIENIHSIIKNNGENFNVSNEEIELSKLLK